jgi:2-hydroxy-3-keto-5-methylthiopentenyl-1-phosphate phosphatase
VCISQFILEESVLPLDSASKDVKNSSLLSDTLEEQDYMTETLQKIEENRDENLKLLKQKLYSIQHHVDYRNDQSGRLCVFHSLFCFFLNMDHKLFP